VKREPGAEMMACTPIAERLPAMRPPRSES
jgi:hypothetical protein